MHRWALSTVTAVCAVFPGLLETRAETALIEMAGRCAASEADPTRVCGGADHVVLDMRGVIVHGGWRKHGSHRISAERVEIGPSWTGLVVHIDGVSIQPTGERPSGRTMTATDPSPPQSPKATRPTRTQNHGLTLDVAVFGAVDLPVPGASVTVVDPRLWVAKSGAITSSFAFNARFNSVEIATPPGRELRLEPNSTWDSWHVLGPLNIEGGPSLTVDATVGADAGQLVAARGRQRIRAEFSRDPEVIQFAAEAQDFPLEVFNQLSHTMLPTGLDLRDARLSGRLGGRLGEGVALHLQQTTVRGLTVQSDKLAKEPVQFTELVADGDLWWSGHTDFAATLVVAAEHINVSVSAAAQGPELSGSATLAPIPCQSFVDSIPGAFAGLLAGASTTGNVDGDVSIDLSLDRLAAARSSLDPEASEQPVIGALDLRFPFLDNCQIDIPAIDFPALLGAYRHRFDDARGSRRTKTMARGAKNFVPLRAVPRLAMAFVSLEDGQFWNHDGFDRQQMQRALWHNVMVGQISRGASTISQQTARNLWLGVDRSLSRKLQEAVLTAGLESTVSKSRILELYLNIIELGPGVHGVEEGAAFHFGRAASELNLLEALHLASLAPAPATYSERFAAGEVDQAWKRGLHYQVRRLAEHGKITYAQMRQGLRDPLRLRVRAPHG